MPNRNCPPKRQTARMTTGAPSSSVKDEELEAIVANTWKVEVDEAGALQPPATVAQRHPLAEMSWSDGNRLLHAQGIGRSSKRRRHLSPRRAWQPSVGGAGNSVGQAIVVSYILSFLPFVSMCLRLDAYCSQCLCLLCPCLCSNDSLMTECPSAVWSLYGVC